MGTSLPLRLLRVVRAMLAALIVALSGYQPAIAAEAAYPSKPVRMIVGQPAGGNADLSARQYAQRLGERFAVQFVVDNRGGGGGVIATELVVNAPPDGYTLLLSPTAHAINPSLIAKLPYDTIRDVNVVVRQG